MKIGTCKRCAEYASRICKGNKAVKTTEDCEGFRVLEGATIPVPLDLDLVHSLRKLRKRCMGEESEDAMRENIALLFQNGLEYSDMKKYYEDFQYDEAIEKFYLR
jgi:hypothetical protein